MSQELRARILIYLEQHSRTGSAEYVDDKTLADATGASVDDVKRQLDILESQGLVQSANSFESHSALITPQGSLAVEAIVQGMSEPERRRIGFQPGNRD